MTSDFSNQGEAQEALFASLAGPPVRDPLEAEVMQLALAEACGVTRQTVHTWTAEKGLPKFGDGYRVRDVLEWLTADRQRRIETMPKSVEASGEDGLARDEIALRAQKTQAEIEIKRLEAERRRWEQEVQRGRFVELEPLRDQWAICAETLRKRLEAVGKSFDCLQHIRQALDDTERTVRDTIERAGQPEGAVDMSPENELTE